MVEIRGKETPSCIEYFAKGLRVSENGFLYGGIFWCGDENYAENLSKLLYRIIKKKDKLEECKKMFKELLEKIDFSLQGEAIYKKDRVIWLKPRELFRKEREAVFERFKEDKIFRLTEGILSTASEIEKSSGLAFLRILEAQGEDITKESVWKGREDLIDIWKNKTEDEEIKEYLSKVAQIGYIIKTYLAPEDFKKPSIFKLFSYLAPFDFKIFEDAYLVSRARLFERKTKAEDLIEELKQEKVIWEDLLYAFKKEGITEEELKKVLEKAFNEKFLRKLRQDWKELLKDIIKGEEKKAIGSFVKKQMREEGWISYGSFRVPNKEISLYIFYEKGIESKLAKFKEGLEKSAKAFSKFTGNIGIKIERSFPIAGLIPDFDKLKNMNSSNLLHQDAFELLFNLLYFNCRLKGFVDVMQNKNPVGILLLLDTDIREEGGGYSFWDAFNFIYEFFSLPVQTLNKTTINLFCGFSEGKIKEKEVQGVYKNLFISLLKDLKTLEFEFEGFHLPSQLNVFAVLEKPSTGFCYRRGDPTQKAYRHFLYEIYKISVNGNRATVELEDKYLVLTGGLDFEADKFRRWIEEKAKDRETKLCFITAGAWEDSYMNEIISKSGESSNIKSKSLFVEYSELPTAYISDKAQEDCFVIYTSEFEKLKESLGISKESNKVSLAIKPADIKDESRFRLDDGEFFYHSSLQVFSTDGLGWERDDVYSERRNLFLFTLLALSQYESESFQSPYSKLDLWQKRKSLYLKIRRNQGEYQIPLNAVLYEMIYLISKIPADKNLG
ncbi:hypothetical protein HRbin13_00289 [bacterium HR13]|nr:hypothetical protein HRbin13_00289 [bacterium HR13]